ncbi:MAG: DUF2934 domain-containing protein [Candidatus Omnitrophica bacterium]|nr:DUF2934 domain-containing protein [Candidatus Omnitrophota bacterium]
MAAVRLGRRRARTGMAPRFVMDPAEVACVAYELYQQRGCQDGHDLDDWLKAEEIVRRRRAEGNGSDRRF